MTTFKAIAAPLKSLAVRGKTVNNALYDIGRTYHSFIPLAEMFGLCESNGLMPLQEDGTPWSGVLWGVDGRTSIDLRDTATGKINRWLNISWYKMPSGRYEVTAYIS